MNHIIYCKIIGHLLIKFVQVYHVENGVDVRTANYVMLMIQLTREL